MIQKQQHIIGSGVKVSDKMDNILSEAPSTRSRQRETSKNINILICRIPWF